MSHCSLIQAHSESVSQSTQIIRQTSTIILCEFSHQRQLTTLQYIEPHHEETPKLTHKIEKSQSNDKVCAPVEDGGDGDGATTDVRRIELTEHQPCHYNTEKHKCLHTEYGVQWGDVTINKYTGSSL